MSTVTTCWGFLNFMRYHLNFNIEPIVEEINGIFYTEEWKDVKGYEGFYGVSTFGRIFSMRDNKIMRQYVNDGKYLTVGFRGNDKRKKYKCHRLVGFAFIPNPENKPEINHDDFDKMNNFYKNLFWVTGQENWEHAIRGGKIKSGRIIKPKVGENPVRYQKVVDTITGVVYDSVYHLSEESNIPARKLRRMLGGERPNITPYLWVKGEYTLVYKKREATAKARYLELRPRIYGIAI